MLSAGISSENGSCWFALRTKSRHEKVVRDNLTCMGIDSLLPTVTRIRQWKDRRKEIEVPLFSCYCFVRCVGIEKLRILKIPGVLEIVGRAGCPESIPESEIAMMKTLMMTVLKYDSYPYLNEGMQVEVIRGVLQGMQGILIRKKQSHRLVVGIRLIQQAVAVEIDAADVVPA